MWPSGLRYWFAKSVRQEGVGKQCGATPRDVILHYTWHRQDQGAIFDPEALYINVDILFIPLISTFFGKRQPIFYTLQDIYQSLYQSFNQSSIGQ